MCQADPKRNYKRFVYGFYAEHFEEGILILTEFLRNKKMEVLSGTEIDATFEGKCGDRYRITVEKLK